MFINNDVLARAQELKCFYSPGYGDDVHRKDMAHYLLSMEPPEKGSADIEQLET